MVFIMDRFMMSTPGCRFTATTLRGGIAKNNATK